MALPLFFERLRHNLSFKLLLSIHEFESSILLLQLFHALHHRGVHAPAFGPPLVKTGAANAVLSAQLRDRNTSLGFRKHLKYLAFVKSFALHCRISSIVENSTLNRDYFQGVLQYELAMAKLILRSTPAMAGKIPGEVARR